MGGRKLCFLLVLLTTLSANATTYFVDASKLDTNSCLTALLACKTILHVETLAGTGDTISIAAGLYRESVDSGFPNSITAGRIALKTNQILIGPSCTPRTGPTQCTAILSGGISIGASATGPDGNGNWSVTGQTQNGTVGPNNCDTGWEGCIYPEDLFFDSVPYKHLNSVSLPTIGANEWWFDYANNTIYFHTNPVGHLVETSVVSTFATNNGAINVTFQNLTFTEFASQNVQGGGIDPAYAGNTSSSVGTSWLIDHCYITLIHSTGIRGGFGMTIQDSVIDTNGLLGSGGGPAAGLFSTPSGLIIQRNTITNNNYIHNSPGNGAGGIKYGNTLGAIIRGNIISNNLGNGLHFDVNSIDPLIDGNTIESNADTAGSGIQGLGVAVEISNVSQGWAIYRNNILRFNGVGASTGPNNQFSSADSQGVESYCNVTEVGNDIHQQMWSIFSSLRASNPDSPFIGTIPVSVDNYVHHNTVIWDPSATGQAGYSQNDAANQPNFFASNTPPDYNMYHIGSTASTVFTYDNDNTQNHTHISFATLQGKGAETHGTIDTINTSGFPTVTITSPADQGTFSNNVTVTATASDASGITKAEIYVDWVLKQTINTAGPYSFSLTSIGQGVHTIAVMAYPTSTVKACNAITLTQTTSTVKPQLTIKGVN